MPDLIITITKRDAYGKLQVEYTGHLVERGATWLCIEAYFNRNYQTDYVHFRPGDRMIEWFFSDRWFNIFEIHDADDDHLKGWYCNITRPATLTATSVIADDLALDVFVSLDARLMVLDEDEFAALKLPTAEYNAALEAVEILRDTVYQRLPPFDWLM